MIRILWLLALVAHRQLMVRAGHLAGLRQFQERLCQSPLAAVAGEEAITLLLVLVAQLLEAISTTQVAVEVGMVAAGLPEMAVAAVAAPVDRVALGVPGTALL